MYVDVSFLIKGLSLGLGSRCLLLIALRGRRVQRRGAGGPHASLDVDAVAQQELHNLPGGTTCLTLPV